MIAGTERILPLTEPVISLSDYLAVGGGQGLAAARATSPERVISVLHEAGLRGRGGAGFPTAAKWAAVRGTHSPSTFVVCAAAEGEPGTFKDRFIIRRNPYQVLEGMAIAAHVVGASGCNIVTKRRFEREIAILLAAIDDMRDLLGPIPFELVLGPDEYLLGEKAAVTNNVETLAHVPEILRRGAEWFRSSGTDLSPGTTVFTLSGDVRLPGVHELPLGLPLRLLIDIVGAGVPNDRAVKAVMPGASGGVLTGDRLDTPLAFESMQAVGSALGSAGFVVYDESACIVAAMLAFSRFLAGGQGTSIIERLERIERGEGSARDLDAISSGETMLVRSALAAFPAEFEAHLGRPCPRPRDLPVPEIVDYDEEAGRFWYEEQYAPRRPLVTSG